MCVYVFDFSWIFVGKCLLCELYSLLFCLKLDALGGFVRKNQGKLIRGMREEVKNMDRVQNLNLLILFYEVNSLLYMCVDLIELCLWCRKERKVGSLMALMLICRSFLKILFLVEFGQSEAVLLILEV